MATSLEPFSVDELLQLYVQLMEELRRRKVLRSSNNPVADYTEHLVSAKLGLTLISNSSAGFDATDGAGAKYQIKGRRLTLHNSSTELSAIRNLASRPFDFLVAVVYHPDFRVSYAAKVPVDVVLELSKYTKHTNAHRFLMRRAVLEHPKVVDVSPHFAA